MIKKCKGFLPKKEKASIDSHANNKRKRDTKKLKP
jgi:hypothetical protein